MAHTKNAKDAKRGSAGNEIGVGASRAARTQGLPRPRRHTRKAATGRATRPPTAHEQQSGRGGPACPPVVFLAFGGQTHRSAPTPKHHTRGGQPAHKPGPGNPPPPQKTA